VRGDISIPQTDREAARGHIRNRHGKAQPRDSGTEDVASGDCSLTCGRPNPSVGVSVPNLRGADPLAAVSFASDADLPASSLSAALRDGKLRAQRYRQPCEGLAVALGVVAPQEHAESAGLLRRASEGFFLCA
jgi:hypothetical protein